MKTPTDTMQTNVFECVPMLYLQKQVVGQIWPLHHSLLTPVPEQLPWRPLFSRFKSSHWLLGGCCFGIAVRPRNYFQSHSGLSRGSQISAAEQVRTLEKGLGLRAKDKSHSKVLPGRASHPPQPHEWRSGVKATHSPEMGSFLDTFQHELIHLQAVWPWANHCNSLSSFPLQ